MGFTLDKVVPWGRSYQEYVNMFDLTATDLQLRILGCGDGPACFNAELTGRGGNAVSVDPVYAFTAEQISSRIAETYQTVMAQMHKNQNAYVWDAIPSVVQLGEIRMAAMTAFLADFETGKQAGRYVTGELPDLPFANQSFGLALSSHLLFLYSAHLSADFHVQALLEMLRVSDEVRVFPLLTLDGKLSPHLPIVKDQLAQQGFRTTVKLVSYEFQRGGNEMLVIKQA